MLLILGESVGESDVADSSLNPGNHCWLNHCVACKMSQVKRFAFTPQCVVVVNSREEKNVSQHKPEPQ